MRKWTPEEVKTICAQYGVRTCREIGADYGVNSGAIASVWTRARAKGWVPERLSVSVNSENSRSGNPDRRRIESLSSQSAPIVCDGVSIFDLEPCHCRYVIGHGADGLSRFCGGFTGYAGSWCPDHKQNVFAADQRAAARAMDF